MRPPSAAWIWRKEIEWFSVALTSLIGMLTSPKEMAPFQMDLTGHPLRALHPYRSVFHVILIV